MPNTSSHESSARIAITLTNAFHGWASTMGTLRRGHGDWAFGLPRATYQKTPVDEARSEPQYRPATGLRTEQACYVFNQVIPVGTTGVRWASRRSAWRHGDCRWDLVPGA